MDLDAALHAQLAHTLDRTSWTTMAGRGPLVRYDGKVRDCYIDASRGERVIVVTDRLSAFDMVIGLIPWKGQVLNQLAQYWFRETAHLAPNHVVASPDPNVCIGREVRPLAVELVMRAYLTGVTSTSVWKAYEAGARTFAGHALPDGLRKNQPLPQPILTPSTKAAKNGHDVTVSKDELLAMGQVRADELEQAAAIAARLFAFGQARAAERGLILADTKYEMGVTEAGEVIVIDEIHTPDSSRYWYADDYEARLAAGQEPRSLDKEYVRRYLAEEAGYRGDGPPPPLPDHVRVEAAKRYIASFEQVTGTAFAPVPGDAHARIAAALGAA
ncbi:MAG: phosphoribosylaminoimidazolesuccinocarboxamide synthase [Myxococcales bacterium]|nr:phosphoribosylaminoimidazolesuccinocarboxamide synthase [Myxococcales bacterium]